jgi:hypothetical protein
MHQHVSQRLFAVLLIAAIGSAADPATAATAQPPLGAVHVEGDLFMRPLGLDETGCMAYEPWSMTSTVPRAPHYRRADGSFTTERPEAACTQTEAQKGL